MQEAYIVAGFRTAVTKSKKGGFRFTRPDDLAVDVLKGLMATMPQLDTKRIDDVIVGNADLRLSRDYSLVESLLRKRLA